jgi:hypothetical protein
MSSTADVAVSRSGITGSLPSYVSISGLVARGSAPLLSLKASRSNPSFRYAASVLVSALVAA